MSLMLPEIDDMPYAELLAEKADLQSALNVWAEGDEAHHNRISTQVSLKALKERLELVTRACQAFEKVTYRSLKNLGA